MTISTSFSWRYNVLFPILSRMPQSIAYLGAKWQSHFFAKRKTQEGILIKQQMRNVFPNDSEKQLDTYLQDYFCMVEYEALDMFYLNHSAAGDLIELENFEEIIEARENNQRVILTGGHYGRFWMAGIAMRSAGQTIGTVTRDGADDNHHGLHPAEYQYRLKKLKSLQSALGGPFLVEGNDLRLLYRALDYHLMTLIFDVPYDEKHSGSVVVPFLGRTIEVPTGIYRIAKKTDARVAPFYMREQKNGKLVAQFEKLLYVADYDEIGFMSVLAKQLEKRILQRPGHWWLWEALPMLEAK